MHHIYIDMTGLLSIRIHFLVPAYNQISTTNILTNRVNRTELKRAAIV